MLGGVAFGLAFMNSALAIVMYFVIPIGWSILGETISALDKPADWLDLGRPMTTLADSTATMTGTDWAQLATASAVWVGLVLVIGLVRLQPHRAEVASGAHPRGRGVCPARARVRRFVAVSFVAAVAGRSGMGRRRPDDGARHSLRAPVTDQNFYFVMADRFQNGIAGQRPRRAAAGQARGPVGLRPDRQGLVPRRRPPGPARPARVHQGPRHHRDLAHAELQEQGGPGQQRLPVGRLPRLLDHRLHADRPAPGQQRRPARADPRRPPARDEGLLRRHHQPHGRRHPLRGGRRAGLHLQGPVPVPHRRRHGVRRPRLRRRSTFPALAPSGQPPCPPRRAAPQLPLPPVRADGRPVPAERAERQGPRPGSTTSASTTTAATRPSSARTPSTATSSGSTTSSPRTRASSTG